MKIVIKAIWNSRVIVALCIISIIIAIIENINMYNLHNYHVLGTNFNVLILHFISIIIYIGILIYLSCTIKRRLPVEFLFGVFLLVMAMLNLRTMYSVSTVFGTPTTFELLNYINPFYSQIDKYQIDEISGEVIKISRKFGNSMTTISAIVSVVIMVSSIIYIAIKENRMRCITMVEQKELTKTKEQDINSN